MRRRRFTAVLTVLALFAVLVPLNSGQSKAAQWLPVAPTQGFEGTFPPPCSPSPCTKAQWLTYDGSHNSVQGTWSKDPGGGYNGGFAAHPRAGVTPYNYNTHTWMRYGPFSLAGATTARMFFWYWMKTEPGYDVFSFAYSCTVEGTGTSAQPVAFIGKIVSGDGAGPAPAWFRENLSLQACAGKTKVWVQFTFTSDQSVNYEGVYVDNVVIQKYVP